VRWHTPPCSVACSFTRDAYDRFLPSTASISSTRVSFALDEVCPSLERNLSVPSSPPALQELPPDGRPIEHPAVSRRRSGSGGSTLGACFSLGHGGLLFHHGRHRPTQCRACRTVSMRRLANPFAAAHASRRRLDHFVAGSVKTSPPHDPTRLPSKGHISSTDALRRLPRTEWHMVQPRTSSLGSSGFAASWALHCTLSPRRCRAALGKHGCLG